MKFKLYDKSSHNEVRQKVLLISGRDSLSIEKRAFVLKPVGLMDMTQPKCFICITVSYDSIGIQYVVCFPNPDASADPTGVFFSSVTAT